MTTRLLLLKAVLYTKRTVFKAIFTIVGFPNYSEIIMHLYSAITLDNGMFFRRKFSKYIPVMYILYAFEIVARDLTTDTIVKLNFNYRYRIDINNPRKRFNDFGKFSLRKLHEQNPNFKLNPIGKFKIVFISVKAIPLPPSDSPYQMPKSTN